MAMLDRLETITGSHPMATRTAPSKLGSPTGWPTLDLSIEGMLPSGVTEVFGEESVGKTSLVGSFLRAAQGQGARVALSATECLDLKYLEALGVNLSSLTVIRAGNLEDLLYLSRCFLDQEGAVLAIDSLTALYPSEEDARENFLHWNSCILDFLQYGYHNMPVGNVALAVNHVRTKKSVYGKYMNEKESAVRELGKYFTSRLELSRTDVSETSYTQVVNVVANDRVRPGFVCTLPADKGTGVRLDQDYLRAAVRLGFVKTNGVWYRDGDKVLGQGLVEAAKEFWHSPLWWKLHHAMYG